MSALNFLENEFHKLTLHTNSSHSFNVTHSHPEGSSFTIQDACTLLGAIEHILLTVEPYL